MYIGFCQLLEEHLFDWSEDPPRMHTLDDTLYIDELFSHMRARKPREYSFLDPWEVKDEPQNTVQPPSNLGNTNPRTGLWGKVKGRSADELRWGDAALQRLDPSLQSDEEWKKPSQWGRLKVLDIIYVCYIMFLYLCHDSPGQRSGYSTAPGCGVLEAFGPSQLSSVSRITTSVLPSILTVQC